MIAGIGIDLVDLARFERALSRSPRLLERLFAQVERTLPPRSLAARFAAKEALIKALGGHSGLEWVDMVIENDSLGQPHFAHTKKLLVLLESRAITSVHVSLSHDAGVAVAFVVAEREA